MPKYEAPSSAPESFKEYQLWVTEELRHIADAVSELETDLVLLKEWNAEPDKLYNGLVAYADGTNWNPGNGRGAYIYANGSWMFLGGSNVFDGDVEIVDGNCLHLEGTVASEIAEICVDSALNAVKMLTLGMTSGGLRGWWFEQPVRLRANTDLFFYDPSNASPVRFTHNGTDFNTSFADAGTKDWGISGLTGRMRDGGHVLMQTRTSTTAALEQLINIINTSDDKIAGYMLFNVTTGQPVWALGPNGNSLWVDATGATVHTPI